MTSRSDFITTIAAAAHKQCFGVEDIAGGSTLFAMNNTIGAMSDAFWNGVLVPHLKTGVMAVSACEEARFTYVAA
ncbi:MAG: hypothetical protein ABR508_06980 [Candidatus Baltobacteraceae bacterium]